LGPTSFSITDYLRRNLDLNKTSHMGTLDPQVTGVLPILLGRACRLSDYFMHKDKTYVGIMRLHTNIEEKKLKQVISKFIGKINQLPPVRSRVKRALREREIKSFDILETNEKDILFSTQVQAGTYIRKLIHDMGLEIGGAHMLELRRTKAGIFDEDKINNLYDFDKAVEEYKKGNEKILREMIVPAEIISTILPTVQVKKPLIKQLLTGKPLMKKDVSKIPDQDKFCIFCEDQFLGIYKKVSEGDIIARPEFVLN
jgi:H/ACA ribonucleoprotein complex subunit 4